jgi:redox-sensitive bicupin YhaK (pirin superfamily)
MITIRKSDERGHADHGWLDTRHTFSFAGYLDRSQTGFRALRVINEDRVAPDNGFGTHDHNNMEIVSYVVAGQLEHRDSTGTGSVLGPGDVQRMTAGSGIRHSEMNPSTDTSAHFLQIWLHPRQEGLTPSYEETHFSDDAKRGKLLPIVSGNRAGDRVDGGPLSIQQDVELFAAILEDAGPVTHELRPGRHAWIQVVRGGLQVNGQSLTQGDGASVSEESRLELRADPTTEFLLFDLS